MENSRDLKLKQLNGIQPSFITYLLLTCALATVWTLCQNRAYHCNLTDSFMCVRQEHLCDSDLRNVASTSNQVTKKVLSLFGYKKILLERWLMPCAVVFLVPCESNWLYDLDLDHSSIASLILQGALL